MTAIVMAETRPVNMRQGEYIDIEFRDHGAIARLILTPEGKNYLKENSELYSDGRDDECIRFTEHNDTLLENIFEDHVCNSEMRLFNPDDYSAVGALTDAPMFCMEAQADDRGMLTATGDIYWFPNYMIRDELMELLIDGQVDFVRAD